MVPLLILSVDSIDIIVILYLSVLGSNVLELRCILKNRDPEHPAGTSKDSDICDLSNISEMKICIVGNGNIHIFKHPAYLSKDLWEIYI